MNDKSKSPVVYVLNADTDLDFLISGYQIEAWLQCPQYYKEEIEKFKNTARAQGGVYSLEEFQNGLNLEELFLDNSYVFIDC